MYAVGTRARGVFDAPRPRASDSERGEARDSSRLEWARRPLSARVGPTRAPLRRPHRCRGGQRSPSESIDSLGRNGRKLLRGRSRSGHRLSQARAAVRGEEPPSPLDRHGCRGGDGVALLRFLYPGKDILARDICRLGAHQPRRRRMRKRRGKRSSLAGISADWVSGARGRGP